MGTRRIEAGFSYMEGAFYKVIELLKDGDKHEYEVILYLGLSYFAIGDFMESYKTLYPLCGTEDYIFRLVNNDRSQVNPFVYKIYGYLSQLFEVNKIIDRLEEQNIYPPHCVEMTFMNGVKGRIIRTQKQIDDGRRFFEMAKEINSNKYITSPQDFYSGLIYCELTLGLVYEIKPDYYYVKAELLEKFNNSLYNEDIEMLEFLNKGKNAVLLKAKSIMN